MLIQGEQQGKEGGVEIKKSQHSLGSRPQLHQEIETWQTLLLNEKSLRYSSS